MQARLSAFTRMIIGFVVLISWSGCSDVEEGTPADTTPMEVADSEGTESAAGEERLDTVGSENPGGTKDIESADGELTDSALSSDAEVTSDDAGTATDASEVDSSSDAQETVDTSETDGGVSSDIESSVDALPQDDVEAIEEDIAVEDSSIEDTIEEDTIEEDTIEEDSESNDSEEDGTEPDAEEEPVVIFSDPVPVSEPYGYGEGWLYSLTVNTQGQVGVLWSGSEDVPFGQTAPPQKLLFSQSDAGVTTFGPPIVIAEDISPGDNEGDVMQGTASILFTWKGVDEGDTSVVFRKAVDDTLTGTDVVVATASGSETLYRPYFIEKNTDEFCIAFQRALSGTSRVELSCSTDGGESFEEPKQLNPGNLSAYVSSGLYDGTGRLVMAYHGHEFGNTGSNKVYSQWSDDNGDSFSSPVVLSASAPAGTHVAPSLAMNSSTVYGAWERGQGGQYDAWFTSSQDGDTWLNPESLPGMEMSVQLRAGKEDVVYATSKIADINPLLAMAGFVRSGDGGATWGELYPIETVGDGYILDHDIVANRQKSLLHMVWWQYYEGSLQDQAFYVMTIADQDAQ